jgi:hypothetical protein
MKSSSKAAVGAVGLTLVGVATLMFSPGAGRLPLGTMALIMGLIFAASAVRLRLAGN